MAEPPIPARYAILLELLRRGPLRASDLTGPTGLTLQGVSYHLKQLEADGLVSPEREERRGVRLTEAGIEALHGHFLGLKTFVDLALSEMLPVEECVALAQEPLSTGDEVALFMEEGRLVARRGESPSQGRVKADAAEGEPVVVTGLTGVVDLEPGRVVVLRLPPPGRIPAAERIGELAREHPWDVLVVAGLEAELAAHGADLGESHRFAPGPTARHAAQVGLDVLVLASWDVASQVLEALSGSRPGAGRVEVRLVDVEPG